MKPLRGEMPRRAECLCLVPLLLKAAAQTARSSSLKSRVSNFFRTLITKVGTLRRGQSSGTNVVQVATRELQIPDLVIATDENSLLQCRASTGDSLHGAIAQSAAYRLVVSAERLEFELGAHLSAMDAAQRKIKD
jgi:hypothetical protein